jgi:pimeloyl-ACP methyl ester carboxylesterase
MGRARSVVARLLILGAVAGAGGLGAALFQLGRATRPPRSHPAEVDLTPIALELEPVGFRAPDDVALRGWLLPGGEPHRAGIVLAHDFGSSKTSMLGLMVRLREAGFTTLAFDFRGHGESEGSGSTLGILEKRDVLGAVGWLRGRLGGVDRLGAYGVGMGAHAAVLAAADRPILRVLVLDGLYPDASFLLGRRFFGGWRAGARHLGFVPESLFAAVFHVPSRGEAAWEVLPRLGASRSLLLLAPAGDSELALAIEGLYARVPELPGGDRNLLILPATEAGGGYGTQLEACQFRVAAFFRDRLR